MNPAFVALLAFGSIWPRNVTVRWPSTRAIRDRARKSGAQLPSHAVRIQSQAQRSFSRADIQLRSPPEEIAGQIIALQTELQAAPLRSETCLGQ